MNLKLSLFRKLDYYLQLFVECNLRVLKTDLLSILLFNFINFYGKESIIIVMCFTTNNLFVCTGLEKVNDGIIAKVDDGIFKLQICRSDIFRVLIYPDSNLFENKTPLW